MKISTVAQQRRVVGFFDNTAEAQQAVQLLLAEGFAPETITLASPTDLSTVAGDGATPPAEADSNSGRFFSSLFGGTNAVRPDSPDFAINRYTSLTVWTQSPTETKQVADLMDTAGAGDMSVNEPAHPNAPDYLLTRPIPEAAPVKMTVASEKQKRA